MAQQDALDLQIRRKRLGLNQRDIAQRLPRRVAVSAVSDFETGVRDDLPHEQGRAEYEAVLAAIEKQQK